MTPEDVDPAAEVMINGGWGDRRRFLGFCVDHEPIVPLVAEVDDRIVGTGVATINGLVGWVGMIFVDEALRGRGIGTTLTEAVIDELERAGCASLVLLASAARPAHLRAARVPRRARLPDRRGGRPRNDLGLREEPRRGHRTPTGSPAWPDVRRSAGDPGDRRGSQRRGSRPHPARRVPTRTRGSSRSGRTAGSSASSSARRGAPTRSSRPSSSTASGCSRTGAAGRPPVRRPGRPCPSRTARV